MRLSRIGRVVACALLLSVAAAVLGGCTPKARGAEPLRVGVIPNIAPEEQRAKYEPFRAYLEKRLGRPVELFVASNYAGVVQAMASGKLDLAYLGGLTYAQALGQMKLDPIVTEVDRETGTERYYSLIIANKDSGIRTLADLKGKTFAFGDPSSTSGSLYPRKMLVDAGYDWRADFAPIKHVVYSGGHDATARAVASGNVDAGGIEGRILARLEKDGSVDASQLVVIDKRLVQGYPWCVPSSMSAADKAKIRDAFLAIDDPKLLDLMRAERYVPVDASKYADIVSLAEQLGLSKPGK